jgi:predicted dehydrogenase
MSDLRIGIIGLGVRSEIAVYAHRPGAGSRIVAACDIDLHRLARARDIDSGIRLVRDYQDLLDGSLDAVFVLTPDYTHEPIATATLEAGIPTFVEKPLATTVESCDRILATAQRHGTPLYVGHNMRHAPAVLTMQDLIERGAIGEVRAIWCRHFVGHGGDYYFRDWHADRRHTTSLLLQKGVHDLDIIHWLAGAYTARVNALGGLVVYGAVTDRENRPGQLMTDWFDPERNWPPSTLRGLNPVIDVEDLSMVNLALRNGVLASYQQCHFTPDYWRNYTVIGTAGRLENFGDVDEGAIVKVWNRRSGYREQADLTLAVPYREGGHGGADRSVVEEFLRLVAEGVPTITSPVAARYAVATAWAATQSLRTDGMPVDVPTLEPSVASHFDSPNDRASDEPTLHGTNRPAAGGSA